MVLTAAATVGALRLLYPQYRNPTVMTLPPSLDSPPASELNYPAEPRNLVIFIADGLGFAHLSAGRVVNGGVRSEAAWDRFEAYGWHQPHPVRGLIIDSAASATALATGRETRYGAVGLGPAGESLESVFDLASRLGFRQAVVTDSYIWDATPAAFVVESESREQAGSILQQLAESRLDVLFGELEDVGEGDIPGWQPTIELLSTRFHMLDDTLAVPDDDELPVAAVFPEDAIEGPDSTPNLPQLVAAALDRMAGLEQPFVMLVETEETDSASHGRDFHRLLDGLRALDAALGIVLDFATRDGRTLVLFTSDHETGGLALAAADNSNLTLRAEWAGGYHTATVVPVMALGPGAQNFAGIHTTAQLGQLTKLLLAGKSPP